jgi:hypothetical protein
MLPPFALTDICLLLLAAAAPASVLSDESISSIDRYGIGGVFMVGLAFVYSHWQKLYKAREADHRSHVKSLNDEIDRLRRKYDD